MRDFLQSSIYWLVVAFCATIGAIVMFKIADKVAWHSHVNKVCAWEGPVRGLDRGAWTHRDQGLNKDKNKAEKAERCKELGFRPHF